MLNNKNNNKLFILDNRIIPLFSVPITMKQKNELKTNKYIELNKNSNSSLSLGLDNQSIPSTLKSKGVPYPLTLPVWGRTEGGEGVGSVKNITKIVEMYSTVLKKYNSKLTIQTRPDLYLDTKDINFNHEKEKYITRIKLIEHIKKDDNYNIKSLYKGYLHLINRYLPYYVYYNSFFKLGLFLPTQIFKPQFYSLKYRKTFINFNIYPAFNLRESLKFVLKGYRKALKIPFINKSSLKRIVKGDLALLYYGKSKNSSFLNSLQSLVNSQRNTTLKNPRLLGYTKSSVATKLSKIKVKGQNIKTLTLHSNKDKKVLIDNNFLPLKPFQLDFKENRVGNNFTHNRSHKIMLLPSDLKKFNQSNFINKKGLINKIWKEEEVQSIVNRIMQKGDSLLKELNHLILNKKNLINKIKLNNLFLSNTGLAYLEKNYGSEANGIATNLNLNPTIKSEYINPNTPILNQYLKSMSIYNTKKKGILIYYNNLIEYSFVKGSYFANNGVPYGPYGGNYIRMATVNKLIFKVYKLLQASFKSMYCLISKPFFIVTPDKITIRLFYFLFIPNLLKYKKIKASILSTNKGRRTLSKKQKRLIKKQYSKFRKIKKDVRVKLRNLSNITLTKIFANKFKILSVILSKIFNKPVEFDLTRLHYPYNDSNILVNLLGIMINKIKLRIIIRRLFQKAVIKNLNKLSASTLNNKEDIIKENNNWKDSVNIPAFLSGIKIKVGGRLLTQSVIPRQTVKIAQRGATQRGKINFLDVARYTRKNKRGAFSITIKSGQNIF